MLNNKRGLSEVISTALFILLSMAALMLVYGSVKNLTNQVTELSPVSCLDIQSNPPTLEKIEYNENTEQLKLTVKRSLIEGVNSFEFVFDNEDSSKKYTCSSVVCGGSCVVQDIGQSKIFYFDYTLEEIPRAVTLYANECELASRTIQL